MNQEIKRYLVSSGVTFVATFLVFSVPLFLDEEFVWGIPTIIAALVAGVRIGIKASWEILFPALLELIAWAKGLVKK